MQYKIINSIQNGNVTVEQLKADTGLSPKALEIGLKNLVSDGILGINADNSYYNAVYESPVPQQKKAINHNKNSSGDKMNMRKQTQTQSKRQLNCTPEQKAFANLVKARKSDIFDAEKVFIHRGAEVVFGGCGDKAFKYKMAIAGYSDKEPVELKEFWLDWDDSALYDEGGLADQIRELLGETTLQPIIKPAIQAQV